MREFFQSLNENVSEECYVAVIEMVKANLINMGISEVHLADYIEKVSQKHGPELLKSAVKGVGNTIRNTGKAAVRGLANSDNRVSNFIKNIPGIKGAVVNDINRQHAEGVEKLNKNFTAQQQKTNNEFKQNMEHTNMIANPQYRAAAQTNLQNHAAQQMINHRNNLNQSKQKLNDLRNQRMSSIKK